MLPINTDWEVESFYLAFTVHFGGFVDLALSSHYGWLIGLLNHFSVEVNQFCLRDEARGLNEVEK